MKYLKLFYTSASRRSRHMAHCQNKLLGALCFLSMDPLDDFQYLGLLGHSQWSWAWPDVYVMEGEDTAFCFSIFPVEYLPWGNGCVGVHSLSDMGLDYIRHFHWARDPGPSIVQGYGGKGFIIFNLLVETVENDLRYLLHHLPSPPVCVKAANQKVCELLFVSLAELY